MSLLYVLATLCPHFLTSGTEKWFMVFSEIGSVLGATVWYTGSCIHHVTNNRCFLVCCCKSISARSTSKWSNRLCVAHKNYTNHIGYIYQLGNKRSSTYFILFGMRARQDGLVTRQQGFVLLTPYQLWVRLGIVQDDKR